jgi:hypothetical protein
MLVHAFLISGKRASRARRSHSFELDRHSIAESMAPSALLDAKSTPFISVAIRQNFDEVLPGI